MTQAVHIFGIRHHGPGGARALVEALADLQPDMILVEGPPDADELLPLASDPNMTAPVALLLYEAAKPKHACFYPFARFSPEWQAINYALNHRIAVRFMDLPIAHRFALEALALTQENRNEPAETPTPTQEAEKEEEVSQTIDAAKVAEVEGDLVGDPFQYLAAAAGYRDGERFWEHLVEQRTDRREVFLAVMEAMILLRAEIPARPDPLNLEARREAWMRKTIRLALKEGFSKIAVVCGAWHAPALRPESMPTASADNKVLAEMPKTKVAAAWVPWTHGRLTSASGYGAGIDSPGWYDHLFMQGAPTSADPSASVIPWFARIARCLREKDLDCSSAHIIEATRLAQTLAAVRGRILPGLEEIEEATLGVLTFGDSAPLALIHARLHVGEAMGQVPSAGPIAPLQLDFQKEQKRLRLPSDAAQKVLELDLRKTIDLERSQLLHRMALLSIPWGKSPVGFAGRCTGTFKEPWQLQWQPEFAIALIEAGVWGNTVYDAATNLSRQSAIKTRDLATVTQLLDQVLLAELPESIRFLMHRLENLAAVAADLEAMMRVLPALANILRYGNVRKTDTKLIEHVVLSLAARITIGLPLALQSLNDEAAAQWEQLLGPTHAAFELVGSAVRERANNEDQGENSPWKDWLKTLEKLAAQATLHGLLAGRLTRICLDEAQISPAVVEQQMAQALSRGADPAHGARWVEGFLKGSGLVLLHHPNLWNLVDRWVSSLTVDGFTGALPLMRRTFALFATGERRQMGQRVKQAAKKTSSRSPQPVEFDETRGARVLPILELLLGPKAAPSQLAMAASQEDQHVSR